MRLIIGSLIVVLVFGAQFNVQITSVCTNMTNNTCTGWSQTGSIIEETPACFPADTELITKQGHVRMDKLRIGDQILAFNPSTGKDEFVTVELWIHHRPNMSARYVRLITDNITIVASPKHNIAHSKTYTFVYAEDMLGRQLFTELDGQHVNTVQEITSVGVYAPMTTLSNYYVRAQNQKVLVHSYASIAHPELVEKIFYPITSAYTSLIGNIQPVSDYMHPLASFFKWIFQYTLLDF